MFEKTLVKDMSFVMKKYGGCRADEWDTPWGTSHAIADTSREFMHNHPDVSLSDQMDSDRHSERIDPSGWASVVRASRFFPFQFLRRTEEDVSACAGEDVSTFLCQRVHKAPKAHPPGM